MGLRVILVEALTSLGTPQNDTPTDALIAALIDADFDLEIVHDRASLVRALDAPTALVLTPDDLPNTTGPALIETVRQRADGAIVPIIVYGTRRSGGSIRSTLDAAEAGADDFIRWPMNIDRLVLRARVVTGQRAIQERLSKTLDATAPPSTSSAASPPPQPRLHSAVDDLKAPQSTSVESMAPLTPFPRPPSAVEKKADADKLDARPAPWLENVTTLFESTDQPSATVDPRAAQVENTTSAVERPPAPSPGNVPEDLELNEDTDAKKTPDTKAPIQAREPDTLQSDGPVEPFESGEEREFIEPDEGREPTETIEAPGVPDSVGVPESGPADAARTPLETAIRNAETAAKAAAQEALEQSFAEYEARFQRTRRRETEREVRRSSIPPRIPTPKSSPSRPPGSSKRPSASVPSGPGASSQRPASRPKAVKRLRSTRADLGRRRFATSPSLPSETSVLPTPPLDSSPPKTEPLMEGVICNLQDALTLLIQLEAQRMQGELQFGEDYLEIVRGIPQPRGGGFAAIEFERRLSALFGWNGHYEVHPETPEDTRQAYGSTRALLFELLPKTVPIPHLLAVFGGEHARLSVEAASPPHVGAFRALMNAGHPFRVAAYESGVAQEVAAAWLATAVAAGETRAAPAGPPPTPAAHGSFYGAAPPYAGVPASQFANTMASPWGYPVGSMLGPVIAPTPYMPPPYPSAVWGPWPQVGTPPPATEVAPTTPGPVATIPEPVAPALEPVATVPDRPAVERASSELQEAEAPPDEPSEPDPQLELTEEPSEIELKQAATELNAMYSLITQQDYFTMLGVSSEADTEALVQGHAAQRGRIEALPIEGREQIRKAKRILATLDEALEVLRIPEMRAAYRRHLA